MSLIKVRVLNWDTRFSCNPPSQDAVINTEEIISAIPIDPSHTRCVELTMRIKFSNGDNCEVIGKPSDLLITKDT